MAALWGRLRTKRCAASAAVGLVLGVVGVLPASASAAPVWNLEMHHNPTHFSATVPGSLGVATITQGSATVNESQEILVTAEAGNFTLSFGGETTAPIAFSASPAKLREELEALLSIGSSNLAVTRVVEENTRAYTVTFQGALAHADVPQLSAANGSSPLTLAAHPQYWLDLDNVGSSPTSGEIKLTVNLPTGLTLANAITEKFEFRALTKLTWACSGTSLVECHTSAGSVPRHTAAHVALEVNVEPALLVGSLTATATLQGGGAAAAATDSEPTEINSAPALFGILSSSFVPDFFAEDGITTERHAGAHPKLLTVPVDFNSVSAPVKNKPTLTREADTIRDLTTDLPPGFIGNPSAVGECSQALFTVGECPLSSQVGRFDGALYPPGAGIVYNFSAGVFNMVHPRGAVTDLAFQLAENPVHVKASLDPANHYAITTKLQDINESFPPYSGKVTIWGVPAESSHDSERCSSFSTPLSSGHTEEACSTEAPGGGETPFVSLPAQCEADNTFRFHEYDSWQNSGLPNSNPEVRYTMPGKMTECDKPRFEPSVEIEPTGKQANTPTGLNVNIHLPQQGLKNANALATPPVKRTTVTLPDGMSFSPSFADGLKSCALAQIKLGTNEPIQCPDASRIGEVTLKTPLLPQAAEGSLYLAAQGDNPFGSLFALYLVLHDTEERGVLIKIPGKIEVNQTTGQITTVFNETPQFPFEDLTLKFRSGPQAPLVNPPSCGKQEIGVEVTSWAQPQKVVNASNTYNVTEGPNGTPCPSDVAHRPFAPKMTAGTLNPSAGKYSPFAFRLTREDQEQELSRVTTILPKGLTAKIADLTPCSDAAIASISEAEGTGKAQEEHPACPASSEIGSVSAGLGAGPGPSYFPGKVYLAGPYKGAPLSLAVVVPALAGPYDLGTNVVRAAIHVDPATAQVTAVSDTFPTILHGVILRVRDVRLRMDKPETILNPTNCTPTALKGEVFGTGGALFNASSPFQVGDCASLGFKPKLAFRLFGGTKRGAHPKFRATVTERAGDANIAGARVTLPHSEFLDQAHIKTVCTRVQFAAGGGGGEQCPPGSIYGHAVAKTPLFATPLEGPVYLRSSSHPLPDLVVALKGPASQPIEIELDGRVDEVNGGIRNTFEVAPDAPAETFTLELEGGNKGLLVNSTNLCASTNRANAIFSGQNGKQITLHPALQNSCKKPKKNKRAHRRHHRRASLSAAVHWLAAAL